MGQKSRAKQQRRQAGVARVTVVSPGSLEVLSVGKGELRLQVGGSPKDRADAEQVIGEMLRKGYTLFVETADGLERVTEFLPGEMVYVVADAASGETTAAKPSAKRTAKRKVPVAGSRATAIGRTAGG